MIAAGDIETRETEEEGLIRVCVTLIQTQCHLLPGD